MTGLKIVVCGNAEVLGCDNDAANEYSDRVSQLCRQDVWIEFNSEFRHWNGGPGDATGGAYVALEGYGKVKDFDHCREALGFMLSGGGNSEATMIRPPEQWPSSEQCEEAFALLEEVREVSSVESRESRVECYTCACGIFRVNGVAPASDR